MVEDTIEVANRLLIDIKLAVIARYEATFRCSSMFRRLNSREIDMVFPFAQPMGETVLD